MTTAQTQSNGASGRSGMPPFPRYSVALVQNESEMLQAPGFDLSSFLSEPDRPWDVDLYTERTLDTLISGTTHYDCVIVGYNATHGGEAVLKTLARPEFQTHVCVLHQKNPAGISFLEGDFSLEHVGLGERWNRQVMTAAGFDPAEEIVLNWPHPHRTVENPQQTNDPPDAEADMEGVAFYNQTVSVPYVDDGRSCWQDETVGLLCDGGAYCAVRTPAPGRWRTILEVENEGTRLPVLLRTSSTGGRRILVCMVLLDHAHPAHASLLDNMVMWCAAGRPTVAVVSGSDPDEAALVHRTLRLQGARSILHESDQVQFDGWPCRGVSHLVFRTADDPTRDDETASGAAEWLKRDGTMVLVKPTRGDANPAVTVKHGEVSDELWAVRLWGAWFAGQPPESWLGSDAKPGSIVRSKAVLQMLAEVNDLRHQELGQLRSTTSGEESGGRPTGYPPPETFREQMKALLEQRIGDRPNCDETVATTIACAEIDRLTGAEVVNNDKIAEWLEGEAKKSSTSFADRLDIARYYGDGELLDHLLANWPAASTASAVLETKLREAVVACDAQPEGPQSDRLAEISMAWPANTVTELELARSPLLAANYLHAAMRLRAHWGERDHALNPGTALDRAITAVARRGYLVSGRGAEVANAHEFVSAEARALMAYFGACSIGSHVVRDQVQLIPPQLVDALVREAETLRIKSAGAEHLKRTLDLGRNVLAVSALVLVAGVLALAYPWASTFDSNPVLAPFGYIAIVVVVMPFLLFLLNRFDLCPDWARRFGAAATDGLDGIRKRLKDSLSPPRPDGS